MTDIPARRERAALCDLLVELGPDQPTLCEGWTTGELAAHLLVRERRPDVMVSIPVPRLADHHQRVVASTADERSFTDVVADLREGPPAWSPLAVTKVDALVNTSEFFVHHEDVRRAQPDWTPRDLDDDLARHLDKLLEKRATMMAADAPCGLVLHPDGRPPIVARRALPTVDLRGPVGELVLFLFGRGDHAQVRIEAPHDAPDDLVDRVRATSFGI